MQCGPIRPISARTCSTPLSAASDQAQPARNYDDKRLGKADRADLKRLGELLKAVSKVNPERDPKLSSLVGELKKIAAEAQEGATTEQEERQRRKVLIFSFFADTVHYIREHLDSVVSADPELSKYRGRVVVFTGGDDAGEVSRQRATYGFAPISTEALRPRGPLRRPGHHRRPCRGREPSAMPTHHQR
jgi:hypothetical protein